ncbi:MAG: FAD-dependent oxidoreductase, partial [Armatimonadota bacterium]
MKKYDIGIIGAGAAGLMAAITASRRGRRTALIERNPRIGRKLLATGNGRCNLTNRLVTPDRYHGSTPELIETVLSQFDQTATMQFFEDLGLLMKEEDNGRIFPRTNQASSVVEIMRLALSESGVDLMLD